MRTIRIFAYPTHTTKERTSGVDFARIIQPMKYLNGYKDSEVEIKVDIFDISDKETNTINFLDIAKKYDAIYFNYLNSDWGFANMKVYLSHFGKKLILDLDDAIWEIQEDNHAYEVWKPGGKGIRDFTIICNEVDYITCTSQYLKNVILSKTSHRQDKVRVFPNYIDLDLYNHKSKFKDDHEIVLLHHGSSTHYNDLQEEAFANGVDRIMKEYPNVVLKTVGALIPAYKKRWGRRYSHDYGDQDVYKWIKGPFRKYHDEADILVVPLKECVYTKAKSSIKFLETSSATIPGVYQDIRQYREVVEDGVNGFLASTSDKWYQSIKRLIDDKKLRQQMGNNAYKTVKDSWQIQDHIKDYASWIKSIL